MIKKIILAASLVAFGAVADSGEDKALGLCWEASAIHNWNHHYHIALRKAIGSKVKERDWFMFGRGEGSGLVYAFKADNETTEETAKRLLITYCGEYLDLVPNRPSDLK
ncbi:hypothetical protein MSG37_16405 [Shewanella sp. 1CM18E]|uniref:hypothetical protein n=1 Tax=Shewanella sp. 1CM18E TaxID=2929169 RepID=UPI0020C13C4A|nr:hypothetical protein [Shewanella sp. 1CM18E]MCK8046470.1 hypothetical protein [Shewanella sp. 1CM18E]